MQIGRFVSAALILLVSMGAAPARGEQRPKPVLYLIGTSHLDSQWNWTVQDSIREFVPATFFENFKRLEKYPHYTFTYEGVIHYMWFKEYFPDDWPKVKKYVADGRWRLAGNWIDAVDVNVPSPESLMRQALYGKRFFRQEFGKVSQDVYLPDCFGFGFALPSIAAHSGMTAFSTQKLTWGSSYGIPFPVGRWRGADGSEVVAALNPGAYVTKITTDVSIDPKWRNELTSLGDGHQVAFKYFGVGDVGGAPDEQSVEWLEKSVANKNGQVEVRNTGADQLVRDLTPAQKAALPLYEGELTMKTHGVGCYTSQAAMKRFNRENELLADSAERAGVMAEYLAHLPYPSDRLREAWVRFLWHQFHDDLTGTSIPQAYEFSWNDELVSANQFAGVLTSSTAAVGNLLDTQGRGIPLIVYNPLSERRKEPVEATVQFTHSAPAGIRVVDPSSNEDVPTQLLDRQGTQARILFLAEVPSVGFKVFHVKAETAAQAKPSLKVTPSSLQNARYVVKIDANGDLASIVDREAGPGEGRELLKAPIRLELRDDPAQRNPAWQILFETVSAPAREYVSAPRVRIIEGGPVRVALEITRKAAGSTFVQRVKLTQGGNRVDVETFVDWKSPNSLLKAAFPLAASNPRATYDLGLGVIARGNNTPDHYEVPAQMWADLTDSGGAFGTAVLNDSKYGWDKPADDVLRLTLLHSGRPVPRRTGESPISVGYPYQSSNDLGHHHFVYAIAGHRGDWRSGNVPALAAQLNQPLIAFQTTGHPGTLGRSVSFLSLDASGQVAVRALKKAEDNEEVVLRLQELYGRPARASIHFTGSIAAAREINAAEEPVGTMETSGSNLSVELKPYQPRTFALRLRPREEAPSRRASGGGPELPHAAEPLSLPFNLDGISTDADRKDGDFDGKGQTLAAELLPRELTVNGVPFKLGSSAAGQKNVLVPRGQSIPIPEASYDRLHILAAAVGGDVATSFTLNRSSSPFTVAILVREWQGPVGLWDNRLREPRVLREVVAHPITQKHHWTLDAIQADMTVQFDPATGEVKGIDRIQRGFVKRDEIAWVGTHRHAPDGNQPYIQSYIFNYQIDLPSDARELTLPNDQRIRIFAVTAVRQPYRVTPAAALYAADLPQSLGPGGQQQHSDLRFVRESTNVNMRSKTSVGRDRSLKE